LEKDQFISRYKDRGESGHSGFCRGGNFQLNKVALPGIKDQMKDVTFNTGLIF
jgi:hypothetical protein